MGGDGGVDLGEDLVEGTGGPAEGVGDVVPFDDELEDGPLEVGEVTITLKNTYAIKHELVILGTDSAPMALPKAKKDEADEAKAGKTMGELRAIAGGAS